MERNIILRSFTDIYNKKTNFVYKEEAKPAEPVSQIGLLPFDGQHTAQFVPAL